jgi:NAD(P)H-dependent FMN reductase
MSSGEIDLALADRKGEHVICRIGIIVGSTCRNRNSEQVARSVFDTATWRADSEFELVDLRGYPLPHLEEPNRPLALPGRKRPHQGVDSEDRFVRRLRVRHACVQPQDLRRAQERDRPPLPSGTTRQSGSSPTARSAARGAQHLRGVAGSLRMADLRQQVALSTITGFENLSVFKPGGYNVGGIQTLLEQVIALSAALVPPRQATIGA